jgi:hypothetical protein
MFAAIMLRMNATNALIHCRKKARMVLNEKLFIAGADLSKMVFMATSLFLKVGKRQRGQSYTEQRNAFGDIQCLERAHHNDSNARGHSDASQRGLGDVLNHGLLLFIFFRFSKEL